jgi:hypothetical protein
MMTGRLRLGAWLVCLGLVAAGLYLALLSPGPASFARVDGLLHDVTVVPNNDPVHPDRIHELNIAGAPCGDYDYLQSWASSVGLPEINDLQAQQPITIYTDPHSCAGFNAGGSAPVRAILYQGRLYATEAYLHPRNARLGNLPAAILLLLTGLAGAGLLVYRSVRGGRRLSG